MMVITKYFYYRDRDLKGAGMEALSSIPKNISQDLVIDQHQVT